jgi:predicted tellurium resistance membrane protein TerC
MEWIADPTAWVGLLTLIALEIVLGIDNLVFIAILSDKLAPEHRARARLIGLSLALVMRLGLLAGISWVMSLSEPVVSFWRFSLSWRDLILIAGGMFLLVKATTEIHERVQGGAHKQSGTRAHAAFWPVVAQIVALDLVFSLDSVITAVGMVDELYIMMAAVVVAVGAMLVAARPLIAFISARPSLIVLCLSFLLMIGLVLVADGLGLHVPKGYVYVAMGFSVLVETLNQLAARRRRPSAPPILARRQVADAILRLLGGVPLPADSVAEDKMFGAAEQRMVGGVLSLGDRPVSSIMTPLAQVAWLDPADPDVLGTLRSSPHREFPLRGDALGTMQGLVRKEDVLAQYVDGKRVDLKAVLRPAPTVSPRASVLDTLAQFKRTTAELAFVVDEQGHFQGLVTRTDLLEAIAGDFPDEGERDRGFEPRLPP